MFRSIFGFAIFAVLAWLGLKIVFGILGGLIGLAMTILWLAALGFLFYLVLRGQPEHRRQDTRHDQGPPGGRLAVPGQQLAGMDVHDLPAFRLLFADEGGAAGLGDVLL